MLINFIKIHNNNIMHLNNTHLLLFIYFTILNTGFYCVYEVISLARVITKKRFLLLVINARSNILETLRFLIR